MATVTSSSTAIHALRVARDLSRGPGWIAVCAMAVFAAIAFVQESVPLRRLGIEFAWESCADFAAATVAVLVVLWTLRLREDADAWEQRSAASLASLTLGRIIGLGLACGVFVLSATSLCLALERITVGETDPDGARALLVRGTAVAAPLAALAPAVAAHARRGRWLVLGWLALGVGSYGAGVPIPLDRLLRLGEGGGDIGSLPTVGACVVATMAGLTLSLAIGPRPPPRTSDHAHRHPR